MREKLFESGYRRYSEQTPCGSLEPFGIPKYTDIYRSISNRSVLNVRVRDVKVKYKDERGRRTLTEKFIQIGIMKYQVCLPDSIVPHVIT